MKRGADSLRPASRRDFKTVPNALLLAVGAALILVGLRFLAGDFDHLIFWRLVFIQDIGAAWLSVILITLAWFLASLRAPAWATGALFERIALWVDRRIAWVSLATFPFYGAFAWWVARGRSFAADEYSVLFQSELFASGRVTARVAPELIDWLMPADFQGHFFHVAHASGTLVSSFWPGYAVLLTPFSLLGVPFLCNAFLTSLSLWAIHRAARRMTDSPCAALWALIFCLASPVISLNAASYFSMPAHLLCNALFCDLLARRTRSAALWAGVVGGFALLLHNPVPHATFALPWMMWLLWRRRDLFWRALLGYGLIGLPLLLTWSLFLNSFDASRHVLTYEARGGAAGPLIDILARLRVAFAPPTLHIWIARLAGMSKLTIWAVPALVVLSWGGAKSARGNLWLRLTLASFWTTFIAYLFVRFDQGAGWGFRYLHSVWLVLPILAGVFLSAHPGVSAGVPVRRFAAWCVLLGGLVLMPFQAWQVRAFLERQYAQLPGISESASLAFVDLKSGEYSDSLIRNDAFLRESHWKLVHRGDVADANLARRVLIGARLKQRGEWGQIWVGQAIRREFRGN